MTQKIKLLSTLLLFMITSECLAVPAYPKPVKVKQPDGTFVTLQMRGDELGYRNIDDTERLCIINGEQVIILNTTYFNFDIPLPSENEVSEKNYDVEGVISYYNYPGHNDAFLLTAPLIPSDETAINTISVSHNDAKTIYNLNGQRISSLHKGFNIVNGKKVWVK